MKDKYVTCILCKKQIVVTPYIFTNGFEKEFWFDSKPYWTNRDSGNIYCDRCLNNIFWGMEICGQDV